jgi:Flp pilus assembly protein TadG
MAGLGDLVDDVNMERLSRIARFFRPLRRAASSQSGQALVETAITMPLFVFLMLGLLQLSLMNQARYMAKYAAYKAARAGSIHNASRQRMENAALGVLMPFVGHAVYDTFYKTDGKLAYSTSFAAAYASNKRGNYTSHGISPVVEVTICGPSSADVGTPGDFDDPNSGMAVQDPAGNSGTLHDWKRFNNGRLQIQVLFYFKLVIPFANMMIRSIYSGLENAETMRLFRMNKKYNLTPKGTQGNEANMNARALLKQYYLPIRSNWSMRMMSNYLPSQFPLPGKPSPGDCKIPFAP